MSARPRRGARGITLAGSVTGAAVVALDGTVLTVVQPRLQRELDATFAQVQWTSTGYLIAVAALLVFAGRLGDRYGHQRLFALGILGFAATSAGIGLAGDIHTVIALRVAQGGFGALLQPATLGMLRAAFPPDRLGMPIAVRTSAIGLAAATGPVIGGLLAAELGWRSVFFLNVPPALIMGLLVLLPPVRCETAPPTPPAGSPTAGPAPSPAGTDSTGTGADPSHADADPSRTGLDLPGACLLAVSLACLVHALVAVPGNGWAVGSAGSGVAGAVAGAVFVRHERRAARPLVPTALLRAPDIVPALLLLLTAAAALHGTLFTATYFLQDVLGLDPFESGLRTLPLAASMVLGAPLCAVLARRYGPRRTAGGGVLALTAGVVTFSRLGEGAGAVAVGGAFLALGAGFAAVMVTATATVVQAAPSGHAGVAGGLKQTVMNVGPMVGVAVATTLLSAYRSAGHDHATGFMRAMGPTLTVLALVAATGVVPAAGLRRPVRHRPVSSPPPREHVLKG
ncbi:MFS transporter [Streptomyces albus subsp. chlorinus]|uniref:MFS transporter n=1 Tax=Streptomyces albus TaxID=1888 RepID=UPI00156F66C2|nr:MFS transporter [Streptomyces albus]NSC24509.1 MFS transporter [Streptomyces albus subsp. chlorinus]